MSMIRFATLAAGVLASIGAGGIFMATAFKDAGRRRLSFTVGTWGLTLGGLALMLGAIAGWFDSQALFGGLLMVVLGTGSKWLPAKTSKAGGADGPAP